MEAISNLHPALLRKQEVQTRSVEFGTHQLKIVNVVESNVLETVTKKLFVVLVSHLIYLPDNLHNTLDDKSFLRF